MTLHFQNILTTVELTCVSFAQICQLQYWLLNNRVWGLYGKVFVSIWKYTKLTNEVNLWNLSDGIWYLPLSLLKLFLGKVVANVYVFWPVFTYDRVFGINSFRLLLKITVEKIKLRCLHFFVVNLWSSNELGYFPTKTRRSVRKAYCKSRQQISTCH